MRLFIALDFNPLKNNLSSIQKRLDRNIAKIKLTSDYHLTLKFLGEVSNNLVNQIEERLNKINFSQFSLTLDNIGVFPNESYIRVIWIGVRPKEEPTRLKEDIDNILFELGFKKEPNFYPHITIGRVKSIKDKEGFIKNLKSIKVDEEELKIDSFKLMESTLTREGPIYREISIFKAKE